MNQDRILTFGKYKGQEIKYIILTHIGYIMWLFENLKWFRLNEEEQALYDAIAIMIKKSDFTDMPFLDESFKLVVFDPPHLLKAGKESWLIKKYGKLPEDWPKVLKKGIDECFRVLENYGVLIFKWNEDQITVKEVLKAIGRQPLFGHTTGRHGKTMWMCFMKLPNN